MDIMKDFIGTGVYIKREDYIDVLSRRMQAQRENTPEAWDEFRHYVDWLAQYKYFLPPRTGLYGISKNGEFIYTRDSQIKGVIQGIPEPDFELSPIKPEDIIM